MGSGFFCRCVDVNDVTVEDSGAFTALIAHRIASYRKPGARQTADASVEPRDLCIDVDIDGVARKCHVTFAKDGRTFCPDRAAVARDLSF